MDDRRRGNGARLSRLLIDKGTEAMRNVFDNIHPPSKLTAVLNSHEIFLKNLRCINRIQFRILFPPDGTASKSEDFDITLLFNLLRHISGLRPPSSTGSWDKNPPSTDTSVEANLARIKYYRNVVYGHITSTGIDDANFQSHWNSISTALIYLGVSSGDIELLRFAPLEENCYLNLIHEWKEKEDKLETILQNHTAKLDTIPNRLDKIEEVLKEGRKEVKDAVESGGANDFQAQKEILNQMAKCNFDGNIKNLSQAFHEGTRQWLFVKLDRWFSGRDPDPRVMILTAGPGVGKSVFAGKVCQMYKDLRQLAACHFCKFNYSDYRNPQILFESLSSHMCQNIPGFRGKLIEQLRRNHSRDTITDAFRVLLNDPLHAIEERDPMMIVIDGLDESETRGKSELLDLIAKEFPKLPSWIKIFITSRPELSVRKKLSHLNPIEIEAGGKNNDQDVKHFLASCLENCNLREDVLNRLVYQCDGSFLFAHHIVSSISRQVQNRSLTLLNVKHFTPKSIGSVYEEYFDRLKKEIEVLRDEKSSGMKFESILEILAAARGPIPLTFVAEALELSTDTRAMKEVIRKVNDRLSALLLAYDDCLTVFHKTVVDWLLSRGYDEHSYTVDSVPGHKLLWLACRKEYEKLKGNAQCEERTKAQEYASQYGMNHLEWISNFHAQIQSFMGSFTTNSIGEIFVRQDEKTICYGYGWLLFQGNKSAYVMTTSYILRDINVYFLQTQSSNNVYIRFTPKAGSEYVLDINENSAIISSDQDFGLDYAVIRLSIPRTVCLGKPLAISEQRPNVGSSLAPAGLCKEINSGRVLPLPSDLIDWLKTSTNLCPNTSINGIPVLSCEHNYDWAQVETKSDNFIPHLIDIWDKADSGFPLVNESNEVVAMHSVSVYIGKGRKRFLVGFAVRMGKIMKDIKRRNLDLAKKCISG